MRKSQSVDLWDLQTAAPRRTGTIFINGGLPTRSAVFSPDGTQLAVGCWDNKVHLYDVATETPTPKVILEGHAGQVVSVAFSPDGTRLISGSVDRTVRLWSLETGKLLTTFEGHRGMVDWVSFAPDVQSIVSASTEGGSIKVWRRATPAEVVGDISGLVELARKLEGDKNRPALLAVLDEAIGIAPHDPQLRMWRGRIQATDLSRVSDALEDYRVAAELSLDDEDVIRKVMELIDLRPLVASSGRMNIAWRFTTDAPAGDDAWTALEYDDSTWRNGEGPFGVSNPVRTSWTSSDIWLRHEFELEDAVEAPLVFLARIDDESEFYVNGVRAGQRGLPRLSRYNYPQRIDGTEAARQALRPGKNVLAVHCHNVKGPSIIDVGLYAAEYGNDALEFLSRLVATGSESILVASCCPECMRKQATGRWPSPIKSVCARPKRGPGGNHRE